MLIYKPHSDWWALIEVLEKLRVDWHAFKPVPLEIGKIRGNQLVDCQTDQEAVLLFKLLKEYGKELHFNVDKKKGLYHIFGAMVVKIDGEVPPGFVALPFYMFQP